MGLNAEIAGYADVEEIVTDMTESENQQLLGIAGEVTHDKRERALRARDWGCCQTLSSAPPTSSWWRADTIRGLSMG